MYMIKSIGGKLFRDISGVSPVIGVILMVLITIVLAAAVILLVMPFANPSTKTVATASFDIKDAPGELSRTVVDSIVVLTPISIQGGVLDLADLTFTVSSDQATWVPVDHSPPSGIWELGTTVTLSETAVDQVSPGPLYVRAFSEGAGSLIYDSPTVYIN
jgi:archaeal flagellin N-terminal-like domain